MADDITLNTGSGGSVLAADDVSSVYYQKVKLDGGGDGATTPIVAGGGVEASALRVTIASDSTGVLTVDGTVTANLSATDNAVLDTIDAVLDTINAKLVTGTVIGDVNLGATDNAVLDTIATNTTGLNGTVSGSELQVDIVSGTVTANLSATDNAVLDTIDAVLDTINAKLVTGTVIGDVNLGATDNAVLDSIVTNTTGLNGTVSGSELQVDVVAALPTGTNTLGRVSMAPATTGGMSSFLDIDLDETAVAVATGASQLYGYYIYNNASATRYVHFYNVAQGSVTVGTTTPDLTLGIPAGTNGAAANVEWTNGIPFGTALTMAATTTVSGADAPGANDIVINVMYAE